MMGDGATGIIAIAEGEAGGPRRDDRASEAGALHPAARARRDLLLSGGVVLLCILLFIPLALAVRAGRTLAFDQAVHDAIHGDDGIPWLNGVMALGPALGTVAVAVAPLATLWLLTARRWRTAAVFVVSVAGALALTGGLKEMFHRVRPGEPTMRVNPFHYLFPSTHTVITLVTYGLLAYLIGRRLHGPERAGIRLAATCLIVFVAVSLIYLDTHYLTDVVGGLLVGGAWLTLSLAVLRRIEGQEMARQRHAAIARSTGERAG